MKLNVEKMVDNMTRRRCVLIDSMKTEDDYSNFDQNSKIGDYIESDKTNLVYLVG